jgi:hypothetical protein
MCLIVVNNFSKRYDLMLFFPMRLHYKIPIYRISSYRVRSYESNNLCRKFFLGSKSYTISVPIV